jgi:hypothetical protein
VYRLEHPEFQDPSKPCWLIEKAQKVKYILYETKNITKNGELKKFQSEYQPTTQEFKKSGNSFFIL